MELDFSNDRDGFEILPVGIYHLICNDAEIKDTESGRYIKAKFKVLEGPYEDRLIFQNFTLVHFNEKAAQIGRGQVKGFLEKAGAKSLVLNDVSDMIGLRAYAKVKIEAGKDGYEDSNKISHFVKKPVTQAEVHKEGDPFL